MPGADANADPQHALHSFGLIALKHRLYFLAAFISLGFSLLLRRDVSVVSVPCMGVLNAYLLLDFPICCSRVSYKTDSTLDTVYLPIQWYAPHSRLMSSRRHL